MTGYVTPLDCLPIQDREKVLQGWATSRLPLLRGLHCSLTALTISYWVRTSPTLGHVLGYPRVPAHGSPAKDGYPFRFLQFPPSNAAEPETINADVVIVGSGCGGAVAAKTLAEAGLKVIVVDKGYYWSPLRLPMSELEGSAHLFDNGGMMLSEGATVTIAAGSTWGGGGTVNWSASLQTQGYVRHEWSQKFGLKYFTSAEFQRDLDAVCLRMGVGTSAIQHNKTNEVLLEGARKLGWSAKTVPQNTGGEAHNCGYCTYGRFLFPFITAFLANIVHQVAAVAARKDQQRLSYPTPRKPAHTSSKASHAQRCSSKTSQPQVNAQQSA